MRIAGTYQTVLGGVSEQAPALRRQGQHTEQVNMSSNPVLGLTRRPPSEHADLYPIGLWSTAAWEASVLGSNDTISFYYRADDTDYDLIYRRRPAIENSVVPLIYPFNLSTMQYMPVQYIGDMSEVQQAGISAIVNIGNYIYFCGNGIPITYDTIPQWNTEANLGRIVAHILGGEPARTYTIKLFLRAGGFAQISYTTMPSYTDEVLDTTGYPNTTEGSIQRTDAYYTFLNKQNQQALDASFDKQPTNIAFKLAELATAAGYPAIAVDSVVMFESSSVYYEIEVSDGGSGSLVAGMGGTVQSPTKLSNKHFNDKVIKVESLNDGVNAPGYYLISKPKGDSLGYGIHEVTWAETAGVVQRIIGGLYIGRVYNGTLYIAKNGADLATRVPGPHPYFSRSACGDEESNPTPFFCGKAVNYMALFQGRLVIGSGNTLNFSRSGDYLNFFRKSVNTVADDDPIEQIPISAEDDVLLHSEPFDRDLIVFGGKRQYGIPGRNAFTPLTSTIYPIGGSADVTEAKPVLSGNYIFYSKSIGEFAATHQMQMALNTNTTASHELSSALNSYLKGKPCEITASFNPSSVFLRTEGHQYGIYVYQYLDNTTNGQRLYDSWSRWGWHELIGVHAAIRVYQNKLIVHTLQKEYANGSNKICYNCNTFNLVDKFPSRPYLDAHRTYPVASAVSPWLDYGSVALNSAKIVFTEEVEEYLIGTEAFPNTGFFADYPPETLEHRVIGLPYTSSVTLTNPYLYDNNSEVVMDAIVTIMSYLVKVTDTAGLRARVVSANKETLSEFSREYLANYPTNRIGFQPINTRDIPVYIGNLNDYFDCTLESIDWLPLTISKLGWIGQGFIPARAN